MSGRKIFSDAKFPNKDLTVTDKSWKQYFLEFLDEVDGFETLAIKSRETESNELNDLIRQINPPAKSIIEKYNKQRLAQARAHYNNFHLIAFWKWLCQWLDSQYLSGVKRDFAAFDVIYDARARGNILIPLSTEYFRNFFYWKVSDNPNTYKSCPVTDKEKNRDKWSGYPCDNLEQILGQFTNLHIKWVRSTTVLYNNFIRQQASIKSPVWDDYKIYYFIDLFLYQLPDKQQQCRAPFDSIFFSNNHNELAVFLTYCHYNNIKLTIKDVADFLDRQRKYYIKLALKISLEQNAFLNHWRHMQFYDPDKKIVVMPELDRILYNQLHDELIKNIGVQKGNGCPFSRSKGVSDNAALEVFAWFDNLMLKLAERWLASS